LPNINGFQVLASYYQLAQKSKNSIMREREREYARRLVRDYMGWLSLRDIAKRVDVSRHALRCLLNPKMGVRTRDLTFTKVVDGLRRDQQIGPMDRLRYAQRNLELLDEWLPSEDVGELLDLLQRRWNEAAERAKQAEQA
jgi:hypothetical protein